MLLSRTSPSPSVKLNSCLKSSGIAEKLALRFSMPAHRLLAAQCVEIQALLAEGLNNSQIHRQTRVSRRCIRDIRLSVEFFGQPYPPETSRPRREVKITPYLAEVGAFEGIEAMRAF